VTTPEPPLPGAQIIPISRVEARISPYEWAFSRENSVKITDHWANLIATKPAMFNGRVLLQHRGEVVDGVFHADYFETDYASFIAWHHMDYPGEKLRNGFAMAALEASDGAFLLGIMGNHTVNAGKIYFAAGTPDLDDVLPDGTVDLAGSTLRELEEETGLLPSEVIAHDDWAVVLGPVRAAFMRRVTLDIPAEIARNMMLERIRQQSDPELSDIYIVRTLADIDTLRMPIFQQAYLRYRLAKRDPEGPTP
jgi:8-oxo-dGTP pyrophosphatase MutT (NUDIX family)